MIIKCNKGNWSGKEITVNVNQKTKSFKLYDHKFIIEEHETSTKQFPTFRIVSPNWSNPLATGCQFTDGLYGFFSGDISRENKNMYVAAVQLLNNII